MAFVVLGHAAFAALAGELAASPQADGPMRQLAQALAQARAGRMSKPGSAPAKGDKD